MRSSVGLSFRRCVRLPLFPTLAAPLFGVAFLVALYGVPPSAAVEGDILVDCPGEPVPEDSEISAEILLDTGGRGLGTYSLDLEFNPEDVVIVAIDGGASPGFTSPPSTDPATFTTGETRVAALSSTGGQGASAIVSVATVRLHVQPGATNGSPFLVLPDSATDSAGGAIEFFNGACAIFVAEPTPTPSPVPRPPCVGDCSDDGSVTVDEIITGVAIALGIRDVEECLRFDGDGDGQVVVTEIVTAVNASLVGCPMPEPTPTATIPPTATATATRTATATPPANKPPIVPAPGLYRAYPGEPIAYVIGARDPEGGNVTYEARDLPEGAGFDAETGVLTWTPSEDQVGPHYVPVTVSDDGDVPSATETLLVFQVALPTTCVETNCDPATGCATSPAPLEQLCCEDGEEPPRIAFADADCPAGGVVFAGRNTQTGIGRLENCDWLRVINFAQTGAAVRLNFETRCLRPEAGIRIRIRIQAPSRIVVDDDLDLVFVAGDNGYYERITVPFQVLGGGPFFDLEFAEAILSVIASDSFGNTVRTDKRVRLTFETLPDLDDPVSIAP